MCPLIAYTVVQYINTCFSTVLHMLYEYLLPATYYSYYRY